ncbi:MAG: acetyl-CoA carboxylase carboxyltransferase subunit beta [Candidatus Cloacimonetes bacterium]|nr:acetyl-CoA carboxylase carboxyltransferase subunit beta [Candidatus Cloacimonadota bacterium]
MGWFTSKKKDIPDVFVKCTGCGEAVYNKELQKNLYVCPHCDRHLRMPNDVRIEFLCDENSFQEFNASIMASDPLGFSDSATYGERIQKAQEKTRSKEAIITGFASIEGHRLVIGMFDFSFMGGSMGSVVGEKIARAAQASLDHNLPLVIFSASGGARMHEGILSLMQMVKTSQAVAKLSKRHLPFISVLCDPTTGGVSASFAMLGDIIMAEPKALIGFAGPRVIEQTIRETLPEGFQTSEFLLEKGVIDMIVSRPEMRSTMARILSFFKQKDGAYYAVQPSR